MSSSIKKCFKSRWGDDGYIVEADFSQLEVAGAALVSGDSVMKQDILDGRDSHCQAAAWMNPKYTYEEILEGYEAEDSYYTKLRKEAKGPNFSLQYGSGAKGMSNTYGVPIKQCQDLIDGYYDRYSTLKQFQEEVMDAVKRSVVPSERRSPSGIPLGKGHWKSSTGRVYTFYEQESPKFMQDRGILTSISPTQIANYPMQGFATGDIVPEVLGRLHRGIAMSEAMWNSCLPINTVHDSIIFDIHTDWLYPSGDLIKYTMESAPEWMWERYGIEIDLPLKVDIEYGKDWDSMTKLDV